VTGRLLVQVLDTASKWWGPFPDPAYAGALVHQVALIRRVFGILEKLSKKLLGMIWKFMSWTEI